MVLVQANGTSQPAGCRRRLSRRRQPLRARRRGLPRRPAAARHRRTPRPGGSPGSRSSANRMRAAAASSWSIPGSNGFHPREALRMPGIVPLADVLRIAGPHVATIQKVRAGGVRRRHVRPGGRHVETDVGAGGHARRRRVARAARRVRRRQGRIARHPGDQAGDQGTARADGGRPRRARAPHRGGLAARDRDRAGDQRAGRAARRSSTGRTWRSSRSRRRSSAPPRRRARLSRKADVIALERRQAEEERAALDARMPKRRRRSGGCVDDQRAAEARLVGGAARAHWPRGTRSTTSA